MRIRRVFNHIAVYAIVLGLCGAAPGQAAPKFEYGKVEEAKGIEWLALAKAGFILTTGNSSTVSVLAGAQASRKEADNKFQAEAGLAYVRSGQTIFTDDGDGLVEAGELDRDSVTTTQAWFLKARYDRFFTEHNSAYGTALVSADKPAGKELVGGGQVGYSRQLLMKEDKELKEGADKEGADKEGGDKEGADGKEEEVVRSHEVVAEVGYDFTYENYVAEGDAVQIHSARLFAGYISKISRQTGAFANVEALFNVNSEDTPAGEVDAFGDTRVTGKAGLSTQLFEDITFSFGFTAKYDQAPAPASPFPGAPFAPGFTPLADSLDTITEATLLINFI